MVRGAGCGIGVIYRSLSSARMSNWGIGLLFTFGPHARPDVLTLRDVEAHCGACGHELVVRYYDARPFHSWTIGAARRALEEARAPFEGTCPQCDAAATAENVVRWVLHFGFPSGRGLVQGFAHVDGTRRWLLSPHESMDVQLVPRWHLPSDQSRVEVDTLTDDAVVKAFARPFNPKAATRDRLGRPAPAETISAERLSQTLALVSAARGAADAVVDAALRELGERWVAAPLSTEGVPVGGFAGAPAEWLPSGLTRDWWGAADAGAVLPALEHIVQGFPVPLAFEESGDTITVRLPDGATPPPTIDARGVAEEAARSMVEVGDAARLELDRLLQALTGLWTGEEDA